MHYGGRADICSMPIEWPAMSGRCLADLRSGAANSDRRLTDIWIVWVVQNCPTGHRPDIDRFIGDQIAMRNTAPGYKSQLNVT